MRPFKSTKLSAQGGGLLSHISRNANKEKPHNASKMSEHIPKHSFCKIQDGKIFLLHRSLNELFVTLPFVVCTIFFFFFFFKNWDSMIERRFDKKKKNRLRWTKERQIIYLRLTYTIDRQHQIQLISGVVQSKISPRLSN